MPEQNTISLLNKGVATHKSTDRVQCFFHARMPIALQRT